MRVGSSMTCHADGFPEPSISMSLQQPLNQFKKEPMIKPKDYLLNTSPTPPLEQFTDQSDIASSTRIGLRPDEYTVRGGRFSLNFNATPGVELLLVCIAGNALPNAADFLGYNKTVAVARFTVACEGLHSSFSFLVYRHFHTTRKRVGLIRTQIAVPRRLRF